MDSLTTEEAYRAMFFFIEELWHRTKYDELAAGILGDIQLLPDNTSADPAAKLNWLEAVEKVKKGDRGIIYANSWIEDD
jgi:hypothetical protein